MYTCYVRSQDICPVELLLYLCSFAFAYSARLTRRLGRKNNENEEKLEIEKKEETQDDNEEQKEEEKKKEQKGNIG